jgi:MFS family permease
MAATSSAVEFAAFGAAGFLVQLLTAPLAIAIDAASFIVSALLLGSIRRPEPPPPPPAAREPVVAEIRAGLRLVTGDPVLRGLAWGTMGLAAMWGVFGTTWLLFITDELRLDPATVGVVAALGGFGSLLGALVAERAVRRVGLGRLVVASLVGAAVGNLLIPLAPAGLPLLAVALLVGQQLIGDTAVTVFDVTEVSVRQSRVPDRQLGRVNATIRVATVGAQLVGTLAGAVLAEVVGLRGAAFLAPLCALGGAALLARSPARRLARLEEAALPAAAG